MVTKAQAQALENIINTNIFLEQLDKLVSSQDLSVDYNQATQGNYIVVYTNNKSRDFPEKIVTPLGTIINCTPPCDTNNMDRLTLKVVSRHINNNLNKVKMQKFDLKDQKAYIIELEAGAFKFSSLDDAIKSTTYSDLVENVKLLSEDFRQKFNIDVSQTITKTVTTEETVTHEPSIETTQNSDNENPIEAKNAQPQESQQIASEELVSTSQDLTESIVDEQEVTLETTLSKDQINQDNQAKEETQNVEVIKTNEIKEEANQPFIISKILYAPIAYIKALFNLDTKALLSATAAAIATYYFLKGNLLGKKPGDHHGDDRPGDDGHGGGHDGGDDRPGDDGHGGGRPNLAGRQLMSEDEESGDEGEQAQNQQQPLPFTPAHLIHGTPQHHAQPPGNPMFSEDEDEEETDQHTPMPTQVANAIRGLGHAAGKAASDVASQVGEALGLTPKDPNDIKSPRRKKKKDSAEGCKAQANKSHKKPGDDSDPDSDNSGGSKRSNNGPKHPLKTPSVSPDNMIGGLNERTTRHSGERKKSLGFGDEPQDEELLVNILSDKSLQNDFFAKLEDNALNDMMGKTAIFALHGEFSAA